ncbi:gamma carbonic anhydrase family protein [Flavobacteriales bacterium]|nr:gamma carbonic anhydrase family protein [Flavobacteriales bacterium]MDB2653196.1 gamma carbonic anhydrase family protein [Flavobacteriales bacterium]MDG1396460.1 gamma carbonic anhydrase family protein [Flavobacteriales bacterium]|tara:strand:- start:156 stop:671 length:516 start_codon:yes stop_codon:yes gene_type:complete
MALVKSIKGIKPKWGADCYLAENATIVGDVTLGDECSIWFNAVVRGDVHFIKIGNRVNIQDGAVIHCTYKKHPTQIGNNVSIGHNALVHGCTVHNNVLIGMGSIVMDNCVVHSNSIVAAGAVLLENTVVESGCIYAGVPAKKVKEINEEQSAALIKGIANNYVEYKGWLEN